MRPALVLLCLCVVGCQQIKNALPVDVQLEVWNRTLDPIYLLDQDGKRLDVPACGDAIAPSFHMNEYEVWFENGHYTSGGVGGQGGPPNQRIFVLSPRDEPVVFLPPSGQLPALPPCDGHLTVDDTH